MAVIGLIGLQLLISEGVSFDEFKKMMGGGGFSK